MFQIKNSALQLILLLGIISLLGDIIYEGGRSVHGQYLKILGTGAGKLGFIIGVGELLGYLFRLLSGFFADKTKSYWFLTIFGYALLVSIPLISFSDSWRLVAFLVILERIGKGIRSPARDTIASFAAREIGTGYGFGLTEFLDQIGAIVGPLIFTFVFSRPTVNENIVNTYQRGYALFWLPFIFLLLVLFYTYFKFKNIEKLEKREEKEEKKVKFTFRFWLYIIFVFLTTLGFVQFPLVGFHLKNFHLISDSQIPLLYLLAMAVDAVIALWVGKIYDRWQGKGQQFYILLVIPLVGSMIPFLVFSQNSLFILVGVFFLGLILGIQETIMKAVVADITSKEKRSSSYGIFNFSFGLASFLGGTLSGRLYDYSPFVLMMTLAVIELLSIIPFYFLGRKNDKSLL